MNAEKNPKKELLARDFAKTRPTDRKISLVKK